MNTDILHGKTTEHLVPLEGTKFLLHHQMISDFLRLQKSAQAAGFDLQIASAFRDFERQLKIWNAKARGERTLVDDQERPLNFSQLSPTEITFAILRWSAIPGCSRHHWGTDIDVFDAKTQAAESVQLVPSECIGEGPAAKLHDWIDQQINQKISFGFYRPYRTDLGGVSPERWHLTYEPISSRIIRNFSFPLFKKNLEENDILLKEILLMNGEEIFQRYLMNFDLP
jgi:LAS superfamily LD-carboxypeptidase LdcB